MPRGPELLSFSWETSLTHTDRAGEGDGLQLLRNPCALRPRGVLPCGGTGHGFGRKPGDRVCLSLPSVSSGPWSGLAQGMGGRCSPGAVLELVQDQNVASRLSCSFSCFRGAVIPGPVPL